MGRRGAELRALCEQPRWSEDEARVVVAACEASGQSVAAFAREHGIDAVRVLRWRSRVEGSETAASLPALLPVTVRPSSSAPSVVVDDGLGVRIEVHDVTAAPPVWLAELVRSLREAGE
jgi:transposase-like protein